VRTAQEDPYGTRQPDDGRIDLYDPSSTEPVRQGHRQGGDKIERLREVRMFEECSSGNSGASPDRTVFDAPAAPAYSCGEPGDEFFLILDEPRASTWHGEARVSRPGAFFGEMSLLDGASLGHNRRETPVRLLVINRRNFSVLLKDAPGLTETLLMSFHDASGSGR